MIEQNQQVAESWVGIVLSGGSGTRLYPMTNEVSKQLLPIYDKPMVYYPISTLMLAGIRNFLVISTPKDLPLYLHLLGTGERIGLNFTYIEQKKPEGIAQSLILGRKFIGKRNVVLILGDNLFYGKLQFIRNALKITAGATIFGCKVFDPQNYGIIEFDKNGKPKSIDEKPKNPKSNYAVPGLYAMDSRAPEFAQSIKPSARGELEITDVLRKYLELGELNVELLGRGIAWLDTGTPSGLLNASNFIESIETRQGQMIACLEEIALLMGYISRKELIKLTCGIEKSDYGKYLIELANEHK